MPHSSLLTPHAFPLKDVTITPSPRLRSIANPLLVTKDYTVSDAEALIHVPGVGSFYVSGGDTVEYSVAETADPSWVSLTLESQVLVALLHQRRVLNFHASSVIHDGRGVMIVGETGAGKSSLTAAAVMAGAAFLSDDLTAVTFTGGHPLIMPLHRRIKLRPDAVAQLSPDSSMLSEAEQGTGKQYLDAGGAAADATPLRVIIRLAVGDTAQPEVTIPPATERFAILRSEVCMWEMLRGMPATETEYLHQLLKLAGEVRMINVVRPAGIEIKDMSEVVEGLLREDKRQK